MSKTWYIIIAVAVVAIVVGWWLWGRGSSVPATSNSPTPTGLFYSPTPLSSATVSPMSSGSNQPSGNSWEGTLRVSDNATRGSLMLMTQVNGRPTNVYLRTARDFTSLVGKTVWVTYEGTLDNFTLVTITAK